VKQTGLNVPFIRPPELATDIVGHHEVVLHAIQEMEINGHSYDTVVLLQPTSPFRTGTHIKEALGLFDESCDMVASVKQPEDSPYYNQFKEDDDGFLEPCLKRAGNRRQDCPAVYTYNGSTYIMRVEEIKVTHMHDLKRVRGHIMSDASSIQIDAMVDWLVAESIITLGLR